MRLIEQQAKAAGFLSDSDDPEDIVTEFYTIKESEPQKDNIKDRVMDIIEDIEVSEEQVIEEVNEPVNGNAVQQTNTDSSTISDGDLF
jgi:hypothetical protein